MKNLLTKAKQDRRDIYLELLEYRNTPIDEIGLPGQLLMSRRLRSIIPTTNAQLQLKVLDPHKVKGKLRLKQEKQTRYFDQHAKHLPTLRKVTGAVCKWEATGNQVLQRNMLEHRDLIGFELMKVENTVEIEGC